jgi:hypothetical protein
MIKQENLNWFAMSLFVESAFAVGQEKVLLHILPLNWEKKIHTICNRNYG